jgi:5-formyltetrahydrofolate cyclo-ligase
MAPPTKDELRKTGLEQRDSLSQVVRTRDSASIRQRLCLQPFWKSARTVLSYVSFRSEVDTHRLIQSALELGKHMVVPVTDPKRKYLIVSEIHKMGDLAPGPFHGIFEPPPQWRIPVPIDKIDLVLAPGVLFDRRGARIGMGGGYFDRLLAEIPHAVRCGLAFGCQIARDPVPTEPHDIPMQYVVTESELITI